MNLTINHILNLEDSQVALKNMLNLKNYVKRRKRFKNRIILTNILGESLINKYNVLKNGDIIKRINGVKVRTLDDVRKALLRPIKKNNNLYITLKTKDNNFFISDLNSIISNELTISKRYKYNLSEIHNILKNDNKKNEFKNVNKNYNIKII